MTIQAEPQTIERFDVLVAAVQAAPMGSGNRRMIALAGPPASGKSTLAESLCEAVLSSSHETCAVVPMDGFHYDDAVLTQRGHQDRKGAPHTFDLGGLTSLLQRLRTNEEVDVAVPVFDRHQELSRASARIIDQGVKTLIVEGNYLLLDDEGWRDLRPLFDLTIMIASDRDELERRLVDRWRTHGRPDDVARAWIDENDLPNVDLVQQGSAATNIIYRP
ncbi:MAG: nucleoside/nucleotide kinase family protein [Pseudomonadota bacterium]